MYARLLSLIVFFTHYIAFTCASWRQLQASSSPSAAPILLRPAESVYLYTIPRNRTRNYAWQWPAEGARASEYVVTVDILRGDCALYVHDRVEATLGPTELLASTPAYATLRVNSTLHARLSARNARPGSGGVWYLTLLGVSTTSDCSLRVGPWDGVLLTSSPTPTASTSPMPQRELQRIAFSYRVSLAKDQSSLWSLLVPTSDSYVISTSSSSSNPSSVADYCISSWAGDADLYLYPNATSALQRTWGTEIARSTYRCGSPENISIAGYPADSLLWLVLFAVEGGAWDIRVDEGGVPLPLAHRRNEALATAQPSPSTSFNPVLSSPEAALGEILRVDEALTLTPPLGTALTTTWTQYVSFFVPHAGTWTVSVTYTEYMCCGTWSASVLAFPSTSEALAGVRATGGSLGLPSAPWIGSSPPTYSFTLGSQGRPDADPNTLAVGDYMYFRLTIVPQGYSCWNAWGGWMQCGNPVGSVILRITNSSQDAVLEASSATPTPTPSTTPSATVTGSASATASGTSTAAAGTASGTATSAPTRTAAPTASASTSANATRTAESTATATGTGGASETATSTATASGSGSASGSASWTASATASSSPSPTLSPTPSSTASTGSTLTASPTPSLPPVLVHASLVLTGLDSATIIRSGAAGPLLAAVANGTAAHLSVALSTVRVTGMRDVPSGGGRLLQGGGAPGPGGVAFDLSIIARTPSEALSLGTLLSAMGGGATGGGGAPPQPTTLVLLQQAAGWTGVPLAALGLRVASVAVVQPGLPGSPTPTPSSAVVGGTGEGGGGGSPPGTVLLGQWRDATIAAAVLGALLALFAATGLGLGYARRRCTRGGGGGGTGRAGGAAVGAGAGDGGGLYLDTTQAHMSSGRGGMAGGVSPSGSPRLHVGHIPVAVAVSAPSGGAGAGGGSSGGGGGEAGSPRIVTGTAIGPPSHQGPSHHHHHHHHRHSPHSLDTAAAAAAAGAGAAAASASSPRAPFAAAGPPPPDRSDDGGPGGVVLPGHATDRGEGAAHRSSPSAALPGGGTALVVSGPVQGHRGGGHPSFPALASAAPLTTQAAVAGAGAAGAGGVGGAASQGPLPLALSNPPPSLYKAASPPPPQYVPASMSGGHGGALPRPASYGGHGGHGPAASLTAAGMGTGGVGPGGPGARGMRGGRVTVSFLPASASASTPAPTPRTASSQRMQALVTQGRGPLAGAQQGRQAGSRSSSPPQKLPQQVVAGGRRGGGQAGGGGGPGSAAPRVHSPAQPQAHAHPAARAAAAGTQQAGGAGEREGSGDPTTSHLAPASTHAPAPAPTQAQAQAQEREEEELLEAEVGSTASDPGTQGHLTDRHRGSTPHPPDGGLGDGLGEGEGEEVQVLAAQGEDRAGDAAGQARGAEQPEEQGEVAVSGWAELLTFPSPSPSPPPAPGPGSPVASPPSQQAKTPFDDLEEEEVGGKEGGHGGGQVPPFPPLTELSPMQPQPAFQPSAGAPSPPPPTSSSSRGRGVGVVLSAPLVDDFDFDAFPPPSSSPAPAPAPVPVAGGGAAGGGGGGVGGDPYASLYDEGEGEGGGGVYADPTGLSPFTAALQGAAAGAGAESTSTSTSTRQQETGEGAAAGAGGGQQAAVAPLTPAQKSTIRYAMFHM